MTSFEDRVVLMTGQPLGENESPVYLIQGEAPRSPEWPQVRHAWLLLHDSCVACGRKDHLNVHHKMPFHLKPELELDLTNLITLCEGGITNCHFLCGHAGKSWSVYTANPQAEAERLGLYLQMLRQKALT